MNSLLSTREAASLLGVGTTSIKRWSDAGVLSCVKTPGGHRRFPREAVERLLLAGAPDEILSDAAADLDAWIRVLVGGLRSPSLVERLREARAQLGSWGAVGDHMGGVLDEIGQRWARGELSELEEHLASERLSRGIGRLCDDLELPASAPTALLVVAEGEQHTLGLALLELTLREAGWSSRFAGRSAPFASIERFVASGGVQLVAVSASSQLAEPAALSAQADRLAELCRPHGARLLLGGAGAWPEHPAYGLRVTRLSLVRDLIRHWGTR